jgi:hypothetical protein
LITTARSLTSSDAGPGHPVPELNPPTLVVTTEIEASKQQAAWAAVDRHILPHHIVSSSSRLPLSRHELKSSVQVIGIGSGKSAFP